MSLENESAAPTFPSPPEGEGSGVRGTGACPEPSSAENSEPTASGPRLLTREEFLALTDEQVKELGKNSGRLPDGRETFYDVVHKYHPRDEWTPRPKEGYAAEARLPNGVPLDNMAANIRLRLCYPGPGVDVAEILATERASKHRVDLPLWKNITTLGQDIMQSMQSRRDEVRKIVAWAEYHFERVLKDRTENPKDGWRGPWWEPSHEFAGLLEMPEGMLNAFFREATGISARERWDMLRVKEGGAVESIRAEIARMLSGRRFVKKVKGEETPHKPGFHELLRELRAARREAGWTRQQRAWDLNFRNHSRLNAAVYNALRKTLVQIEAETVMEIARTWSYDPNSCIIFQENTGSNKTDSNEHQPAPQPSQQPIPEEKKGSTPAIKALEQDPTCSNLQENGGVKSSETIT